MRRLSLAIVVAAGLVPAALAGAVQSPTSTLRLPNGFQPEGISIAAGSFYVGSIPTGAVYRGSLATGRGSVLVRGAAGHASIGLEVDRGRIFVAGGDTGRAFVYDARTGRELASYEFVSDGSAFVNDVVVTRSAAWFTDSRNAFLYKLPLGAGGQLPPATGFEKVPLRGAIRYASGFNVNGIDAIPTGGPLVIVQSNTGRLFTVNPGNGVARAIALRGGTVSNGDGILLSGRTLYVVRNQDNVIAVVRLTGDLRRGTIVRRISDRRFDVPTTVDQAGRFLYAVNARFGTNATPRPGTRSFASASPSLLDSDHEHARRRLRAADGGARRVALVSEDPSADRAGASLFAMKHGLLEAEMGQTPHEMPTSAA